MESIATAMASVASQLVAAPRGARVAHARKARTGVQPRRDRHALHVAAAAPQVRGPAAPRGGARVGAAAGAHARGARAEFSTDTHFS